MGARLKVAVVVPAYNEAERIERLLPAIPRDLVEMVIVVDDNSADWTGDVARQQGAWVIHHTERTGPGPAIRDALALARSENMDAVAVMAANGKHDPEQIGDLLRPLIEENLHLVRGSRFLAGGSQVNMPWHRLLFIHLFTLVTSLAIRQHVTDATGGYQAYRLSILDDADIDLDQPWLGRYEVETYLFVKTALRGYRWKEVPIRINYPEHGRYTRARPIVDWWGYFRPVVLLALGLRH